MKTRIKTEVSSFKARSFLDSVYVVCDNMKRAIDKGKVNAEPSERELLVLFMTNLNDFLVNYCILDEE